MLETIREFGLEHLEASGEGTTVRRRHAEFFLGLVAEPGAEEGAWFDLLEREHDNLRAALAWCQEQWSAAEPHGAPSPAGDQETIRPRHWALDTGVRLATAMCWLWYRRATGLKAGAALDVLASDALAAGSPARARLLRRAGQFAWLQGTTPRPAACCQRA